MSVLDLAEIVWQELKPNDKFSYVSDKAYKYDVQKRIPDVSKAKDLLGFTADIKIKDSVSEVIDWTLKYGG